MLNDLLCDKGLQLHDGADLLDVEVARANNMRHHNFSLFKLLYLELGDGDAVDSL